MAARIINPDHPAAGVMVSVTQLSRRRPDCEVDNWIMDSGAFTEVARHGGYRRSVQWYFQQILRWAKQKGRKVGDPYSDFSISL